jgi:predicted phage tail protein
VGSGGVWTDWLAGTTATSATFGPVDPVHLVDGTTYYFRCRAVDHAGNVEAYPGGDGDAWTTVHFYSTFLPLIVH